YPPDDLPPDDIPDDDLPPDDLPPGDLQPGLPDDCAGERVAGAGPRWPGVLAYLAAGPGTLGGVRRVAGPGGTGLLGLVVPLGTLTGVSAAPGQLSRLGVIGAAQARQLAELAAGHPATRWRIILTDRAGEAIAVTAMPRSRSPG